MKEPIETSPQVGDFIVVGGPDGYAIERVRAAGSREIVSTENHRLPALEAARALARSSNTQAWTYELDNQFSRLLD